MPNYRRLRVPGGTYFFTVNLADRSSRLLVERIDALRASVREVMRVRPFTSVAWVVLPDHMHALWALPEGDADFATRWMRIKQAFCDRVPRGERIAVARRDRNERGLWQRRYWEHRIRDERDLRHHIDYIHLNPVKHGLARRVAEWPHSSFHRFVRDGALPPDWTGPPGLCRAGEASRRRQD
jgi:putative transposase